MPDNTGIQFNDPTGGSADWSNLFGGDGNAATTSQTGQTAPTPSGPAATDATDFANMFGDSKPAKPPAGDVNTPPNSTPTEGKLPAGQTTPEVHPDNTFTERMKQYQAFEDARKAQEAGWQQKIKQNEALIKNFETPGFNLNRASPEEYHKAQANNEAYKKNLADMAGARQHEAAIAQKAEEMGLRHPAGMGDEEFRQMVTQSIRNGDLHTYVTAMQDIDPEVRKVAELNQNYVAAKAADQTTKADKLLDNLTAAANVGPDAYKAVRDTLEKDPTTKDTMSFFGLHELPKDAATFDASRNKFGAAIASVRGLARDFVDNQSRLTNGEIVKMSTTDKEGKEQTTPEGKAANAAFTIRGPGGATVINGDVYRVKAPGGGTRLAKDTGLTVDELPQLGKTLAITAPEDDKAMKEMVSAKEKHVEAANLWADTSKVVNDPRFAENPKMIMSYVDGSSRAKSGKSVNMGLLNATEALNSTAEEISTRLHMEKSAVMNMLTGQGGVRMAPEVLKFIKDDVGQQKNIAEKQLADELGHPVRAYMQRGGMLKNIGLPEDMQGALGDAAREGRQALLDRIDKSQKAVNPNSGTVFLLAQGTPGGVGDLQPYAAAAASGGAAKAGAVALGAAPAAGGGAPAPTGPVDPSNPTAGRKIKFDMPGSFPDGTPPNDSAKAAQAQVVDAAGKAALSAGMTPTATNHVQALVAAAAEGSGYNTNGDKGLFGDGRGDAATQTKDRVQNIVAAASKDPKIKAVLDNPAATPDQILGALRTGGLSEDRAKALAPTLSRMLGVPLGAPAPGGQPGPGGVPASALAASTPGGMGGPAAPAKAVQPQAPAPVGSVKRAYQDLGATPGELEVIHIESGFKNGQVTGSNVGHGQFSPDLMKRYGITNPDDPAQVLKALRMERGEFEKAAGRPISDGEFYMSHQQGHAGGPALLRAASQAPDAPAWQTIRQFYPSERIAKLAIWGNVPDNVKAQFGSVDNVSNSAFTNMWTSRFGGAAAGPRSGGAPVVNAPTAVPGGYDQPDLPRGPAPRSGGAMAAPPSATAQPQMRPGFVQPPQPAPTGPTAPVAGPEPVQPQPQAPAATPAPATPANAGYTAEQAQAIVDDFTKRGIPVPPELAAMAKPKVPAADAKEARIRRLEAALGIPHDDGEKRQMVTDAVRGVPVLGAISAAAQDPSSQGSPVRAAANAAGHLASDVTQGVTLGAVNPEQMVNGGVTAGLHLPTETARTATDPNASWGDVGRAALNDADTAASLAMGAKFAPTRGGATAADAEHAATLAKGRPPAPSKEEMQAVKAGTADEETLAKVREHASYQASEAYAKAAGHDVGQMVHAHRIAAANEEAIANGVPSKVVTKQEAIAARPMEAERAPISAEYENLHRDVGAGADTAKPVPTTPPNSKLKNGPISEVNSATNKTGPISAEHAGRAVEAENRITAPIADIRKSWLSDPDKYHTTAQEIGRMSDVELKSRDLQNVRSAFLDEARAATKGSAEEKSLNAIAKNIREQQKLFYEKVAYPNDPAKAAKVIKSLETTDKRYAIFMQKMDDMKTGGDIVTALKQGGKEADNALRLYQNFAQDADAVKAAKALASGQQATAAWAKTSKAWNSMWNGHLASGASTMPLAAVYDVGHRALRRFTTLKAAGSPATFENVFGSELRTATKRTTAATAAGAPSSGAHGSGSSGASAPEAAGSML